MQNSHLSDLFRKGRDVKIVDADGNEYPLWLQRPSGLQQERARDYANAKVARYRLQAKDPDSDVYATIRSTVNDEDFETLVAARVKFEESEVREGAFQVALYGEESEWSKDDKYMSVLNAMTRRLDDIEKYNAQMEEAGASDRIDPQTDQEMQEITAEYERFHSEVADIVDSEIEMLRGKFSSMPEDKIREEVIEKTIDLDVRLQWYEAYQLRMLSYACRYPEDHKKLYFDDPDDVYEIPLYVRQQLFAEYDELERGSDDVKNSLSLLSS